MPTAPSFISPYTTPFYAGTATSREVPSLYHCALDSHSYLISQDEKYEWAHKSVPVTRANLTGSSELGENSLNPDSGWPRSQSSWHRGAGQLRLDDEDSDRTRFRASRGLNPWVRNELSLLNDVALTRASSNVNLEVTRCGDYVYLADGTEVLHSTDLTAWTSSAINVAESAQTVQAITSNGVQVFAALGVNGIHVTDVGAAVSTHYNDVQADNVAWLKSRLIASLGPQLFDVPASPATAPAQLFAHPVAAWRWVGFAEGKRAIYAAGYAGDKSQVYRVGVKDDGSGLSAPTVAGELPDGEIVSGLGAYLGFVLIGSNLGVRLAQADTNGDLTIGPLIATGGTACFEGQDAFVWFGWSGYDSGSTGLGRLSLAFFNDSTPAWASDLLAPVTGAVTSVLSIGDRRVFTVSGVGVHYEQDTLVASATLETGLMAWGTSDPKVAQTVQARHSSYAGSHLIALSTQSAPFIDLGAVSANDLVTARQVVGESFEVQHTFVPDVAFIAGPVMTRWTLTALPAPNAVLRLTVPLQLRAQEVTLRSTTRNRDVSSEVAFLEGLRDSRKVFTYQELGQAFTVTMSDFEWHPEDRTGDTQAAQGIFYAVLTTVGA